MPPWACALQGMTSAAARVGQGAGDGGVSEADPNLVAYWKFDEGQGFLVKDATGRGHDLRLTSQPRWMVCCCPGADPAFSCSLMSRQCSLAGNHSTARLACVAQSSHVVQQLSRLCWPHVMRLLGYMQSRGEK